MEVRRVVELFRNRPIFSWALYDWANSVFATTVMAGFFPVFFKEYWSAGSDAVVSTAQLGFSNSIASVFILVAAPILGAIADGGGARKKYLGVFTALGIVMSAGLWFVAQGDWAMAALVYVLAVVGFSGGIVFYDALIMSVSPPERYDEVSSFGFSLGYIGGGVLFAGNVAMVLSPSTFGLPGAAEAVRLSFLTVAVWWLVFSIPLFRNVPEPPRTGDPSSAVGSGLRSLAKTMREHRTHRMAVLFLVAYFFYIDGVHTIIRMAVDYGLSLGFPADSLIVALLIVQFVGFPAALVFGLAAQRVGPKPTLYFGVVVYVGVTIYAYFMTSVIEFYVLAVVIGLVQGGVQAVSRSLYARFVPAAQSGEFFGFFNMIGRFAAILGPSLVAITGLLTGSSRLGILSVIVLLVIGAVLLGFVREREGSAVPA
ncbi:MAG: MFS transporter [Immundisolibacterales bacterium]|nr:MFS transporter [Immundisolibacterales bacterium]